MAEGWTNYDARLQYQQYDVTDDLLDGENVIAALLTDGWYRGALGADNRRNKFGTKTALAARLEIGYEDGSTECIETDESWMASQNGPIREGDLKLNEIYDARLEMPGWNKRGYVCDKNWHGRRR